MKPFEFKEEHVGEITLKKLEIRLAENMFQCVDKDRERLDRFLPWVEYIRSVRDEENYIRSSHINWKDKTVFDYGIFFKDQYIGNMGVHNISWSNDSCELGYWILGDFEGKGYVSKSVRLLEDYLFSEGFHRIQIGCSSLNHRSAGVPQKNGYSLEGTFRKNLWEKGAYRDSLIFSKLVSEFIQESGKDLIRQAIPSDLKRLSTADGPKQESEDALKELLWERKVWVKDLGDSLARWGTSAEELMN